MGSSIILHCVFLPTEELDVYRCSNPACGRKTKYQHAIAVCPKPVIPKYKWKQPLALGDWLAWLCNKIGLTEKRYEAMRGPYRVVGGFNCVLVPITKEEQKCGCKSRRQWLNELGFWLASKMPFKHVLWPLVFSQHISPKLTTPVGTTVAHKE